MQKYVFAVLTALLSPACATTETGTPKAAATSASGGILPNTLGVKLPDGRSAPKLVRIPYTSTITKLEREYLVYLPAGYENERPKSWPVMLFMHGDGERGNAKSELDRVMKHGPLHEAWENKRDLPFIIISPQLPSHETLIALGIHSNKDANFPDGDYEIDRSPHNVAPNWDHKGPPRGWFVFDKEIISMVDATLTNFRGDERRVYLTGLSYGGFGTWDFAAHHPTKFAAVAPICGAGDDTGLSNLAAAQTPLWAFHGGRDPIVLPEWQLKTVQSLVRNGHRNVRFTVHEDLEHNSWERVYGGWDLYDWFLQQSRVR